MRRFLAACALFALASCMPPSRAARALLHPGRRRVDVAPTLLHRDLEVESDGVKLKGWIFPAAITATSRSTTVVYLHGLADNRASGLWIAERLVHEGFDVVAYDSRAHGESGGDACTYGYYEKRDLARMLDQLGAKRVVLVGASLGAAVALQAAADDARVIAVVASAVFTDLASIGRERAPWFASERQIREALGIAERDAKFEAAAVSPVEAARRIRVPGLIIHGADDRETRPDHSRRVFAALAGPKQLLVVPGAGHDDALGAVWGEAERWMVSAVVRDIHAVAP